MLDQDITEQPRGAVNAPDDIDHGDDDDVAPPSAPAAANFPASHLAQDLKRPRQEGDGAPSDRGGRGLALPRGLPDAQYAALSLDRLSVQLGNLAVQVTNLPSQVARAIPAALRAHEEADRARYASMRESPSLEARIGLCRTLGDLLNLEDLELRVSNSDQLVICVCCHSHVVGSQGVFRLDQDFPHLRAAIAAHVATTVHARAVADAAKKHKVMLQCTAACSPQLCVFSADH